MRPQDLGTLIFDGAVVRHGFADYARDYQMLVDVKGRRWLVQFRGCVEAHYELTLPDATLRRSLDDDRLTESSAVRDVPLHDAYVWGTRWVGLYPGLKVPDRRPRADDWSVRLGRRCQQVEVATNLFHLELVFTDIAVEEVDQSLFSTPEDRPAKPTG